MSDEKETKVDEIKYEMPFTYQLQKPLRFESGDITELVFSRELDGDILEDLPIGNMQSIKMKDFYKPISKVTGRPLAIISKLKGPDIMKAVEIFNHFLAGPQETGETSK